MSATRYEIHPAIGIARVGSSKLATEAGYFLGPEPGVSSPAEYRDRAGFLNRQAARFRVFACERDDDGTLFDAREVSLSTVRRITWTVHLVNRKGAAWRRYESERGHRNHATGNDLLDQALIINPGPRSVSASGEHRQFDSGKFRTTQVILGEILMDSNGRLLVLGGHGHSGSDPPQPRLTLGRGHFAVNDNWFDDTSDGPVTATIELLDGSLVESHAWIVVAPPDFAPGVTNLVTLYDLLFDRAVARGLFKAPTDSTQQLSFVRHIRPIFERALGYRWVNRQAAFGIHGDGRGHGPGGSADFSRMWKLLADPSPASKTLRCAIVDRLRNPDSSITQPTEVVLVPRLSGDEHAGARPNNVLPLTRTQYRVMQAWARGEFTNDLNRPVLDNEQLPDALDRMALEACVGGALFPGIEANAAIMNPSWFQEGEPFRLSHTTVRPGMVTELNAVPWQADYHLCRWEERSGTMPKNLAWWPAQRPDDVYTERNAATMVSWTRGLGDDFQDMIDKWDRLGIVVNDGTSDAPFFLETERDTGLLGP